MRFVDRVVDSTVPARLGRSYRFLLSSSVASNLGDGISLAAGPLLVASQTRDPLLVALAALLQRLPWLLFGLLAGAIADRVDRRRLVIVVDSLRTAMLLAVAVTIVTGTIGVAVVLVAMFLLGTAETFADLASSALLPSVVEREDLGVANARIMGGFITANQLVGPPIGAALFAIGMVWPFTVNALCVAFGAVLISRVTLAHAEEAAAAVAARSIRREVAEGMRWLWHHAAVRTLAVTIVTFNVTYGAAWSVLVLYARDHLHMGEVGFGLLTTAGAVGGIAGTAAYGWLERRFGLDTMMRAGLAIETLTHLALALTTSAWVALLIMAVFGAHAFIWGTTSTTIRQRVVPDRLRGRVGSVYMLGMFGGIVVGNALGGLIASRWGLTAPFWFGAWVPECSLPSCGVSSVTSPTTLRRLRRLAGLAHPVTHEPTPRRSEAARAAVLAQAPAEDPPGVDPDDLGGHARHDRLLPLECLRLPADLHAPGSPGPGRGQVVDDERDLAVVEDVAPLR
jgi:MFS family permease